MRQSCQRSHTSFSIHLAIARSGMQPFSSHVRFVTRKKTQNSPNRDIWITTQGLHPWIPKYKCASCFMYIVSIVYRYHQSHTFHGKPKNKLPRKPLKNQFRTSPLLNLISVRLKTSLPSMIPQSTRARSINGFPREINILVYRILSRCFTYMYLYVYVHQTCSTDPCSPPGTLVVLSMPTQPGIHHAYVGRVQRLA